MLEDDFTHVIRKAFKGLALAPAEAAVRAGLPEREVLAFSRGRFSADTARRLGPVLGLGAEALSRLPDHLPRPLALAEIQRLDLPFENERTNAWLLHKSGGTLLFDTGYLARSCADALAALGSPDPDEVLITHAHVDHIGGMARIRGPHPRGWRIPGTDPLEPGDSLASGPFVIRACDLSGHAVPALGYHIEGLAVPVLVTGDALFAGSIGGCASPELYQLALFRLREILGPLPDETVLLPGHGPATTLGEERKANPFLAEDSRPTAHSAGPPAEGPL